MIEKGGVRRREKRMVANIHFTLHTHPRTHLTMSHESMCRQERGEGGSWGMQTGRVEGGGRGGSDGKISGTTRAFWGR